MKEHYLLTLKVPVSVYGETPLDEATLAHWLNQLSEGRYSFFSEQIRKSLEDIIGRAAGDAHLEEFQVKVERPPHVKILTKAEWKDGCRLLSSGVVTLDGQVVATREGVWDYPNAYSQLADWCKQQGYHVEEVVAG